MVDDFVAEHKGIKAHSNQRIVTTEDNLNKKLEVLKNDFEHKWDNLQDSIENLIDQKQCPPEEECQSDTIIEEQCQQQPHQGLIEDFIELSEGLSESSYMCDVVFPREKREEILPFITEEDNGEGAVEEHQEKNLPLPPTDSVYILPTPAAQSTPKTPTTKATPSALPVLHNIRKLVATIRAFSTTSKTLAAANVAWHSGWFGCWFGFVAPEPRHF